MGAGCSAVELTLQQFSTTYLTINFRDFGDGSLRFMQADQKSMRVVWNVCNKFGLVKDNKIAAKSGVSEISLTFLENSRSADEQSEFRLLCCHLLEELFVSGWRVLVSSDLMKYFHISNWLFERQALQILQQHVFCMSFVGSDELHLVNAPDEVVEIVHKVVAAMWSRGISSEEDVPCAEEFSKYSMKRLVLGGRPWDFAAVGMDLLNGRLMLARMLRQLAANGWMLYTSLNSQSYLNSADSIYFRKDVTVLDKKFFIFGLSKTEAEHLIDGNQEIYTMMRSCFEKNWENGLQRVDDHDEDLVFNSYTGGILGFKVRDNPWLTETFDNVTARLLTLRVLQSIRQCGWKLCGTLDLSKRVDDMIMLVFESCAPADLPICGVGLNGGDKLRLLNASPEVVQHFRDKIIPLWPKGLELEKPHHKTWEFRMNGVPFPLDARQDDSRMRGFASFILQEMRFEGWELLLAGNISTSWTLNRSQRLQDPDPYDHYTWLFCQDSRFVTPRPDGLPFIYDYADPPKQRIRLWQVKSERASDQ